MGRRLWAVRLILCVGLFASLVLSTGKAGAQQLEVKSWRCEEENGYIFVHGEVRNVTNEPLKHVMVVGIFHEKDGTFVKSADALVEYDPLLAGQSSPFKAGTTHNPLIKSCDIGFKTMLGGQLSWQLVPKPTPKAKKGAKPTPVGDAGYRQPDSACQRPPCWK